MFFWLSKNLYNQCDDIDTQIRTWQQQIKSTELSKYLSTKQIATPEVRKWFVLNFNKDSPLESTYSCRRCVHRRPSHLTKREIDLESEHGKKIRSRKQNYEAIRIHAEQLSHLETVNPEPEVKLTYKKRKKKQKFSKFPPRKKIKTEKSVIHSCFICSDRFDQESKLKSHILSKHEGKGPYQCSKCEREFSRIRYEIFGVFLLSSPQNVIKVYYFCSVSILLYYSKNIQTEQN